VADLLFEQIADESSALRQSCCLAASMAGIELLCGGIRPMDSKASPHVLNEAGCRSARSRHATAGFHLLPTAGSLPRRRRLRVVDIQDRDVFAAIAAGKNTPPLRINPG